MIWYIKILLLLLLLLKNEDILCLMYNEKKITRQQGQTQDFKLVRARV